MFPKETKYERTYQFIEDYMKMSFAEVDSFPEEFDPESGEKMTQTLIQVGHRLGGTVEMISDALVTSNVLENPHHYKSAQTVLPIIFKRSLSLEVLVSLYIQKNGSLATIDPMANICEAINDAYADALHLCEEHYMAAPNLKMDISGVKLPFIPAIPSHLYLIFFELLKNAMRATVEHHGELSETLPDVVVTIKDDGLDGVLVTLEDRGGGIPQNSIDQMFDFFSSSASVSHMSTYTGMRSSPMCGYGFGLGLARIYSRYFGGNLGLVSTEGIGTKVFVRFISQPDKAVESIEDIY